MGIPPKTRTFSRQCWALIKKTLLILVVRRPLSTLLQAVLLPTIILLFLCLAKKLVADGNRYGVGIPAPVRSLRESLSNGKKLVIVSDPELGPDVSTVVQTITDPLDGRVAKQVVRLETEDAVNALCPVDSRGLSPCHAVLIFNDSPLTEGGNGTWIYTIQTDPARQPGADYFDVRSHSNSPDLYFLPLQVAVDNAITNSTVVPEAYMYTQQTEQWIASHHQMFYLEVLIGGLAVVPFISYLPVIGQVTSTVATERAQGLTELIDAMGSSPAARICSYVVSFGILYLPCWVITGFLYWYFLLPNSNPALLIAWQILSGLAVSNASIMASTFFRSNRAAGICVVLGIMACAGGATVKLKQSASTSYVLGLSSLFPSANYVFTLAYMARFQLAGMPIRLDVSRPPKQRIDPFFRAQSFSVSLRTFWAFLALQIVIYPLLAVLVEIVVHSIYFRHRSISLAADDPLAVEISDLRKVYRAPWYIRMFCTGKSSEPAALDGINMSARKNQILCLLGANGSGKTTALNLIGGQLGPTAGHIKINAAPDRLGICPQKNVLFSRLTVLEHVRFWSHLKGGTEDADELARLVEACGLARKSSSQSGTLSGGQKRMLQLACMLAGGSTVCLMDEVTSGLDPLSRRAIWNVILAERSRRSMVFTTHFLDEGEVLADYIVILSKGQVKCEGFSAELKSRYGGGYRVLIPHTVPAPDMGVPATSYHDHVLYSAPDSRSAAQIVTKLEDAGYEDIQIAGPTMEDVFFSQTDDIQTPRRDSLDVDDEKGGTAAPVAPGQFEDINSSQGPTSFWHQIQVLVRKRFNVLPRYLHAPLFALLIPTAVIPLLKYSLQSYHPPVCDRIVSLESYRNPIELWSAQYNQILIGPPSINDTVSRVLEDSPVGRNFDTSSYNEIVRFSDDYDSFRYAIKHKSQDLHPGGIYVGDGSGPPTIAYSGSGWLDSAVLLQNMLTQIRSGQKVQLYLQSLPEKDEEETNDSLEYVLYSTVILAIFPAFFALYPAYEKVHKIRSLQYSNGVRPVALWTAHLLFDSIIIVLAALSITTTVAIQYSSIWFGAGWFFPVLVLYGIAATLGAYIVSVFARSQMSAFFFTAGILSAEFAVVMVSFLAVFSTADRERIQSAADKLTFSVGLIFPIMNVFKSSAVGLNLMRLGCRNNGFVISPLSLYAYGGSILVLCLQIPLFALILLAVDGGIPVPCFITYIFSGSMVRRLAPCLEAREFTLKEEAGMGPAEDVIKEASRVDTSDLDLVRIRHVSKAFEKTVAVDDLSLGLRQGEILALLGPNGAGKTTTVDMVRGDIKPDRGQIFLNQVDVLRNTRLAQRSVGVCPQFDALDLLTAKQHLEFYARIRGAKDAKVAADATINRVGLATQAFKQANELSGGDKRKVSLGIALMGNPDVLLLDEPSSSMDAVAKRTMWKTLKDISPGRSLLLTTHSMEEADAVASRVAILANRLLAVGTTRTLRQKYSNVYHVHLVLQTAPNSATEEMGAVEDWIQGHLEGVALEGQSLCGQIKFTVLNLSYSAASSEASGMQKSSLAGSSSSAESEIRPVVNITSTVARVITALETNKEALHLAHYSLGATTLERVFLNVVKDAEVVEENKKRRWWRWER